MENVFSLGSVFSDDILSGIEGVVGVMIKKGRSFDDIMECFCSLIEPLGMDISEVIKVVSKTKIKDLSYDTIKNDDDTYEDDYGDSSEDGKDKNYKNLGVLGLYLSEISKYPLLSREEEIAYAKMVKDKDPKIRKKGRDGLARHNLRLVVNVAKKRRGSTTSSMSIEDLVGAGNVGLMEAIDKYDLNKGCRFSTIATFYIRRSINSTIENESKTVRLPSNKQREIKEVFKFKVAYMNKHDGEEPDYDDIATYMGRSVSYIKELMEYSHSGDIISIDEPVDPEKKSTFGDSIVDKNTVTPDEIALRNECAEQIDIVLQSLPHREYIIAKSLLGINCTAKAAEDVAKETGMTVEAVRKALSNAMRKLKSPARKKELAKLLPYIDADVTSLVS